MVVCLATLSPLMSTRRIQIDMLAALFWTHSAKGIKPGMQSNISTVGAWFEIHWRAIMLTALLLSSVPTVEFPIESIHMPCAAWFFLKFLGNIHESWLIVGMLFEFFCMYRSSKSAAQCHMHFILQNSTMCESLSTFSNKQCSLHQRITGEQEQHNDSAIFSCVGMHTNTQAEYLSLLRKPVVCLHKKT